LKNVTGVDFKWCDKCQYADPYNFYTLVIGSNSVKNAMSYSVILADPLPLMSHGRITLRRDEIWRKTSVKD